MNRGPATLLPERREQSAEGSPSLSETKISRLPEPKPVAQTPSLEKTSFTAATQTERVQTTKARPILDRILHPKLTADIKDGKATAAKKVAISQPRNLLRGADIVTRFMRWLESQIKALIEKFFTVLKSVPSALMRFMRKTGDKKDEELDDVAKEKLAAKKKDIEEKAVTGPSIT